jgi:hypothetical protein
MKKYLLIAIVCFVTAFPLRNFSNYILNERDNRPVKYIIENPDGSRKRAPENIKTDTLVSQAHLSKYVALMLYIASGVFLIIFLIKLRDGQKNSKKKES